MGNIQSSNNYSEKRFPPDDSSKAVLRKVKSRKGREVVDTWSAEYYSFGRRRCELDLTKTNRNKHEEKLSISIRDHASDCAKDYVDFQMNVTVEEGERKAVKTDLINYESMERPSPFSSSSNKNVGKIVLQQ
ncbi:hypothetical protein E2542_SST01264 [Spatholobus suberectus]|nr:hypothetical protein E2542_SST01264 [Spatholobus suberectus]